MGLSGADRDAAAGGHREPGAGRPCRCGLGRRGKFADCRCAPVALPRCPSTSRRSASGFMFIEIAFIQKFRPVPRALRSTRWQSCCAHSWCSAAREPLLAAPHRRREVDGRTTSLAMARCSALPLHCARLCLRRCRRFSGTCCRFRMSRGSRSPIALIAPLALRWGCRFRWDSHASPAAPSAIPWAWGLNASASVIAAITRYPPCFAIHPGFGLSDRARYGRAVRRCRSGVADTLVRVEGAAWSRRSPSSTFLESALRSGILISH